MHGAAAFWAAGLIGAGCNVGFATVAHPSTPGFSGACSVAVAAYEEASNLGVVVRGSSRAFLVGHGIVP